MRISKFNCNSWNISNLLVSSPDIAILIIAEIKREFRQYLVRKQRTNKLEEWLALSCNGKDIRVDTAVEVILEHHEEIIHQTISNR